MGPMVPMAPKGVVAVTEELVVVEAPWPVAPPFGGGIQPRGGLAEGQPRWPPLTLGFILVSFTGTFADILGSIGW